MGRLPDPDDVSRSGYCGYCDMDDQQFAHRDNEMCDSCNLALYDPSMPWGDENDAIQE